jgi:hypothetical protein
MALRVNISSAHKEQNESALPLIADLTQTFREVADGTPARSVTCLAHLAHG